MRRRCESVDRAAFSVGDHVKVKCAIGRPYLSPHLTARRLDFWGLEGTVVTLHPGLDRPVVVAFSNPAVPGQVRFEPGDLQGVEGGL